MVFVDTATERNLRAAGYRIIDIALHPLKIARIDHARICILVVDGVLVVHAFQIFSDALDKTIAQRLRHDRVIDTQAGLAEIESPPDGNIGEHRCHIAARSDDGWTFATQLQRYRG